MDREFHKKLNLMTDKLFSVLSTNIYYPITSKIDFSSTSFAEIAKKLTKNQLSILRYLSINGETSLRKLAWFEELSVSNISKVINPLITGEFVERKLNKGNTVSYICSQKGNDFINSVEEYNTDISMALFNQAMSDEKQEELYNKIEDLANFLENNYLSNSH